MRARSYLVLSWSLFCATATACAVGSGSTSAAGDGAATFDASGAHPQRVGDDDGGSEKSSGDGPSTTTLRPVSPLSTSRVTSRRPTLHWALPSGLTDVTIELCSDRACSAPLSPATHVTGRSFTPLSDLPTGTVFWRLHPGTDMSRVSATWEFTVGARTAPVDSSWGTMLDVNGDGFVDLAVSAWGVDNGEGRVHIYLGGPQGIEVATDGGAVAATTLIGPDGPNAVFGSAIASAGDVNGDGFADLVIGANGASSSAGKAYLYLGGPSGLTSAPTIFDPPGSGQGEFGAAVASAGDVNGDGYADVIIGAPGAEGATISCTGAAYVYLGGASGVATTPSFSFVATAPVGLGSDGGIKDDFGASVSAMDLNGDGFSDVLIGSPQADNDSPGHAYVYLGSASGLPAKANSVLAPGTEPSTELFGYSVANAGDVNGDGFADVIVGLYSNEAYVYLGGAAGISPAPPTVLTGAAGFTLFGTSAQSAGDINGDGYSDLVVGDPSLKVNGATYTGAAYVFLGGPAGISVAPATIIHGPDGENSFFAQWVTSAGDINHDGYADLAVGSSPQNGVGAVHIYLGSGTGLPVASSDGETPAALTLIGPDGPYANFGGGVFGATN